MEISLLTLFALRWHTILITGTTMLRTNTKRLMNKVLAFRSLFGIVQSIAQATQVVFNTDSPMENALPHRKPSAVLHHEAWNRAQ